MKISGIPYTTTAYLYRYIIFLPLLRLGSTTYLLFIIFVIYRLKFIQSPLAICLIGKVLYPRD